MIVDYTYKINGQVVHPNLSQDAEKVYEMADSQRYFRARLTGKISLHGKDFDWLDSQPFSTEFVFEVKKGASVEYTGKFYKTDCKFDRFNKSVELANIEAIDGYTEVLAIMDKEVNLIEMAPRVDRIQIQKRPLIQVYRPGDDTVACFLSGTMWEQEVNDVVDDEGALVNVYNFALMSEKRECTVSKGGSIDVSGGYLVYAGGYDAFAGNGLYKASYALVPEYDEYENPTGRFLNRYWITRLSDFQILYSFVGLDGEYGSRVVLHAEPGSGAEGTVEVFWRDLKFYGRYLLDVSELNGNPTVAVPQEDITENNSNYRRCLGYAVDLVWGSGLYSQEPTKYGLNDYGTYFLPPYTINNEKFYPISRSGWGNVSYWFRFADFDYITEEKGRKAFILRDSYEVSSAIGAILKKLAPSITHENDENYSIFLNDVTNPVSGQQFRLLIAPKSNLIKGDYDTPAKKAPIKLKEILDMLRDVFQLYWFIDYDGVEYKLRIEHISFFKNGGTYSGSPIVGTDLTALQNARIGKPWAYGTDQWEIQKGGLPAAIQFKWMDSVSTAFEGQSIEAEAFYIDKSNTETIQVSKFTTDVDFVLLNPSEISLDGFAMFAGKGVPGYVELVGSFSNGKNLGAAGELVDDPTRRVSNYIDIVPGAPYRMSSALRIAVYDGNGVFLENIDTNEAGTLVWAAPKSYYGYYPGKIRIACNAGHALTVRQDAYILPFQTFEVDRAQLEMQNGYLSWYLLHTNFWRHDLPARQVKINGETVSASGVKKAKMQNVEYPLSAPPNFLQLIRTGIGDGELSRLSVNLTTNKAKAELKFDIDEQ